MQLPAKPASSQFHTAYFIIKLHVAQSFSVYNAFAGHGLLYFALKLKSKLDRMRQILILSILLVFSYKARCQAYPWGASPEQIIRLAPQLGYELDEQKTNDHGNIFLVYRAKPGVMVSYIFSKRKLLVVKKYYDTQIAIPPIPSGEERTQDSTGYWGDTNNNALTMRKYKDKFVVDEIIPMSEPSTD